MSKRSSSKVVDSEKEKQVRKTAQEGTGLLTEKWKKMHLDSEIFKLY